MYDTFGPFRPTSSRVGFLLLGPIGPLRIYRHSSLTAVLSERSPLPTRPVRGIGWRSFRGSIGSLPNEEHLWYPKAATRVKKSMGFPWKNRGEWNSFSTIVEANFHFGLRSGRFRC